MNKIITLFSQIANSLKNKLSLSSSTISPFSFPALMSSIDTNISSFNFYVLNNLSSYISDIVSLPAYAFANCTNLKYISCSNCSQVGAGAFKNCTSLQEIYLPICSGGYTSDIASQLTKVTYGYSATFTSMFQSCYSLIEANFPSCTFIADSAFYTCYSLKTINFPTCTTIGSFAFKSCWALEQANFPSCSIIRLGAFDGCSTLSIISFPLCTQIQSYAFRQCGELKSINFPNCSYVHESAFYYCSNLSLVQFSSRVIIEQSAFAACNKLQSLYLYASSVCTLISYSAFQGTLLSYAYSGLILVPRSLISYYKADSVWKYVSSHFQAIEDYPLPSD